MKVKQFFDEGLAHASYAIISENQIALIDPARDTAPYQQYAEENEAKIVAVLETHPHADFVSSHWELHDKLGATVYIHADMGADYPHQTLEDGEVIEIGKVQIKALYSPGHSPDHSAYLLLDESDKAHAVFTGDSLFVHDVGRPDLREGAGKTKSQREDLARKMFHTIHHVFSPLDDEVLVYPAHGAGSLCGKNMSSKRHSSIGEEKEENWAFQIKEEAEFVKILLEDQPYVPYYFPFDVEVNRKGAKPLQESMRHVTLLEATDAFEENILVIDTRPQKQFKQGHVAGAFNIMNGEKFETWLGSIVKPEEAYYLIAENEQQLEEMIWKAAKIGYETQIKGALAATQPMDKQSADFDLEDFKAHPEAYHVVDIRNPSEGENLFDNAQRIPLNELREKVDEVKTEKPIVVHCAGGYRSAAGSSILESALDAKVYDLSEAVKEFTPQEA